MSALWPKTLRGWFTAIALAALALSQAVSLGLLAAQETILRTGLHEAEAFRRISGLVALSDNADVGTRAAIAMTASSANFSVGFSDKAAVAEDRSSRTLARVFSRLSGRPTQAVRAAWRDPGSAPARTAPQSLPSTLVITRSVAAQGESTLRIVSEAKAKAALAEAQARAGAAAAQTAAAYTRALAQASQPPQSGMPAPPVPPVAPVPPVPPLPPTPSVWIEHFPASIDWLEFGSPGPESTTPLEVSVRLTDGAWLNVRATPIEGASAFWPLVIAGSLTALIVAATAFWAAGRVARPLAGLTDAATRLGQGDFAAKAPVSGPSDIARAGQAFNTMADRLNRTIEDQRALLNAVGHDLRTPIATMRVRAEQIADPDLKGRMLSTLAEMEGLTAATLSAARGGDSGETPMPTDLASLTEAVCDDLADAGMPVSTMDVALARVLARPNELRRAVRNLVENAVRYGGSARARVRIDAQTAIVDIDDDGPGIPEDQLTEVLKPFVRLEASRNRDTGGHGLGLTIARAIAERHGGMLTLANRPEGGLRVSLRLPIAP